MLKPAPLRTLALAAAVLAVLTFLTGLWWSAQAEWIQLVRPDTAATAGLFGTAGEEASVPGTPLGSPQKLIVRSPEVFLPGQGEGGLRYVDEPKLRALGEYPLQQKTVKLLSGLFTLGLLIFGALLGLLSFWMARRPPQHQVRSSGSA